MVENKLNKLLIENYLDGNFEYYTLINISITDGAMHENCMIYTFRYANNKNNSLLFLDKVLFPYLKEQLLQSVLFHL